MKFDGYVTQITVKPVKEPTYSEALTRVTIEDEGAGAYIVLDQQGGRDGRGTVAICAEEWPAIQQAIERMFSEIERMEETEGDE